ncbi:MAG: hypothetical protein ACXQS8_01880, partial [Candidatus Helarchaeales archaeon]
APTQPLSNQEIEHVMKFLSLRNKFVILTSSASSLISSNLNLLTGPFGVAINNDLIHVPERNDAQFFPIIKEIQKHPITKGVKQLLYSGASLDVWGNEALSLAITDKKIIPPKTPIIALACEGKLLVLGGHTLFLDEPRIGIRKKHNEKFVKNIFTYIKKRISGRIRESTPVISAAPEIHGEIEERPRRSHVKLKDAKKKIEKAVLEFSKKLDGVKMDSDLIWNKIAERIDIAKTLEELELHRKELKKEYEHLREIIEDGRNSILSMLYEFDGQTKEDLQIELRELIDKIYVVESEAATKLDTIRNNLIQLYNGKKSALKKEG